MNRLILLARIFALFVAALYFWGIWQFKEEEPRRFYFLLFLGLAIILVYLLLQWRKNRKRKLLLNTPFKKEWRALLEKRVFFYQKLNPEGKEKFENALKVFLGTTKVTGVNTEVDDEVKVLVGASAIIPIFGFPDWEYHNLNEVLIYPGAFNSGTYAQKGKNRETLGMVGTGVMKGKMILSKPALINGFNHSSDGHNTGIHEFVHLLDGADGEFDGIPHLMDKKYVLPWLGLMHREMKRISRGKSELRPYGATNKQEFFAVASEFFFERPDELKLKYPKLYDMLSHVFRQDLRRQFSPAILRKLENRIKVF